MATSSVMQSTLVSPVTGIVRGLGSSRTAPCSYKPLRQQRNSGRVVRCVAEDGKEEEVVRTTATRPPASSSSSLPSPPPPPPKPKVSTDFFDVFAFSGPAPERINGRLAMIGFVAAIAVELSKGEDVFAQISNGGIPWFLLTSGVFSVASLIPLFSGVSV
ncbi:chlorophyll a/b-binding protein, partial [Salmonella enterica subsp. enterica serovar Paratyphi A]